MRIRAFLVLMVLAAWGKVQAAPDEGVLKFLISVEQQTITAPYPIRATLHLHNSGQTPLWLYRPVRQPTGNGSALVVQLTPAEDPEGGTALTPGRGVVFERVGFPRPRVVRLDPGEDYTERTTIKIVPAMVGPEDHREPVWGLYRMTATYNTQYPNAAAVERIVDVDLWEGEVTGNAIDLELQPAIAEGSISGRIMGNASRPLYDVLVSLSDEQEHLVDQTRTDFEGRYSFEHVPMGRNWVTVRRMNFAEDTVQFRHVDLTPEDPDGTMDFLLLPREVYDAEKLLHKPVLFRITDKEGRPLSKVRMKIIWSSGTVLETLNQDAADDGTIALQLLPRRHYLTLKRPGCRKEEQRIDVAEGDGIDGFTLHYDCGAD